MGPLLPRSGEGLPVSYCCLTTGGSGPYTYEPCDDVDPTPDYENVLTD